MVKISVIIPVYNEEKYLAQCLDSLCGQTLQEIEIICVDDGSTDNTPQILSAYARRDARIRVITQKNQFAGAARNRGMESASGKYLSFLDADDYYEPDMLEKMWQKAEAHQADIVLCRYWQMDEETGEIFQDDWEFEELFLDGKEVFAGKDLACAGIFQIAKGWAWDKLFRADFVKECGYRYPEFRSSEDGYFVYALMARACRMAYIREGLAIHRIAVAGSLSNTREKNWPNGFKMWQLIGEELKKQGLFSLYERSFVNEFLFFMTWHLESLQTFEAFRDCYEYIRHTVEAEYGLLTYEKGFFFQQELYEWYQEVQNLSLAEYLFRYRR